MSMLDSLVLIAFYSAVVYVAACLIFGVIMTMPEAWRYDRWWVYVSVPLALVAAFIGCHAVIKVGRLFGGLL